MTDEEAVIAAERAVGQALMRGDPQADAVLLADDFLGVCSDTFLGVCSDTPVAGEPCP